MIGSVIVGAGHAGLCAALSARQTGFEGEITLIETDGAMPPYERPRLSKWDEGSALHKPIVPAEILGAAGLTLIKDRVDRIDRDTKTVMLGSGRPLPYGTLLLATGARARQLKDVPEALTLRDKTDADAICAKAKGAKSAVIIGAGFIGLELAASLRSIGCAVRIVEQAPRILCRGATTAIAEIVQTLHLAQGVEFSVGATMDDAELSAADLVVAGIGSIPNTELAAEAGLYVANGVVTDQHLRSSDPHIYAAGDCCAAPIVGPDRDVVRLEAWIPAGQQGKIAGQNMAATSDPVGCRMTPFVWSDQYDHVLQIAGLPDPNHAVVERRYGEGHHISFGLEETGRLAFVVGIAPGAKIAKDVRFAMKLMEAGVDPDPAALADPGVTLKGLWP